MKFYPDSTDSSSSHINIPEILLTKTKFASCTEQVVCEPLIPSGAAGFESFASFPCFIVGAYRFRLYKLVRFFFVFVFLLKYKLVRLLSYLSVS